MTVAPVVDVSVVVRIYGAVLLCLRLLRALATGIVVSAFFVLLWISACLGWAAVALAGWRFAGLPWLSTSLHALLGAALGVAAGLVLLVQAVMVMALVRGASRGSAPAGYVVITLSAVGILAALAGLIDHGSQVLIQSAERSGDDLMRAASNLFPLYVSIAFLYAGVGVVRLAKHPWRDALIGVPYGPGWVEAAKRLLGWPTTSLPRIRRRRVSGLAALALACEGMAFGAYFSSAVTDMADAPLYVGVLGFALGYPIGIGALYGFLALADVLWTRSRRAGQLSISELVAFDQRRPVLFLRSFADDQVALRSASVPLALRVLDPGVSAHQLEELVVANLAHCGPVFAIGRPGDAQRPIGAAREYVPDEAWQPYVTHLMAQARLIVVSLSTTQGLTWELEQLRRHRHLDKTIVIVPPDLTNDSAAILERSSAAGLQLPAQQLASQPGRKPLAAWTTGDGATTVVTPGRPTELAYVAAMRLFVADHGSEDTGQARQAFQTWINGSRAPGWSGTQRQASA